MEFQKITSEISRIIVEYNKALNPMPDYIMELYRRLTGYLWYYSEYVSDAKGDYNQKYFIRKIETIREKSRLVKENLAVNRADIEAMLATEDQFMEEIEAESLSYRADLLLRQGNKVAECMRTHISLLKKEREQTDQ
jgi:hypothetical protein